MKVKKLERFLFCLVVFAALLVWASSRLLVVKTKTEEANAPDENRNDVLSASSARGKLAPVVHHQGIDSKQPPFFVLHIGPPKTATTTIQCGLQHLNEKLALDDSYYFVGKTCPQLGSNMENNESAISGHHLLMGLNGGNSNTRGYIGLNSRMKYHLRMGNHMIYSNEGFANHMEDKNVTWQYLKSLFVGWKVRIIIGYRHYFEWIRSLYYQQYLNTKKYKTNWPNQGKGQEHPSFLWYLDYHLHRFETGDLSVDGGHNAPAFGHHLSLSTYQKFAPYFDDIQFFNLYDNGDLLTNFVCNMLPLANRTCNRVQSDILKEPSVSASKAQGLVKRVSKSFDAERIAEAAFLKGYIDVTSPKPAIVKLVDKKIKKTGLDSNPKFLACPSPSLEKRFLTASIVFERKILSISRPDMSTEHRQRAQDAHIAMFQNSKARRRFCEVDPDAVLRDDNWAKFLSDIGIATAKNESGE